MQSANLKEIKAAIWEQAFIGCTQVRFPMGRVVQIRRRKGQLLAMIYGWGCWYAVPSVTIERLFVMPPSRFRLAPAGKNAKATDYMPGYTEGNNLSPGGT